jgi:hypothetical protein
MRYSNFVIVIVLICAVAACKKKNNEDPLMNLKMTQIGVAHSGTSVQHRVTYAMGGNVDSMAKTGSSSGFMKMTYVGQTYTIANQSGQSLYLYTNADGNITKVFTKDTLLMFYTNGQIYEMDVVSPTNVYPFFSKTVNTYGWSNGDLTNIRKPANATFSYYYDNSKSGQAGDAIRIRQFLDYGRSYTKTSHLPIGLIYNGDSIEQYYYEFDGQSRVTKLTNVDRSGSGPDDTTEYTIQY